MEALLDTKNQAWKSDKSSFGYRMLSKMGWKEGKGLGIDENGATSSIHVRRRRSGVGIGAEKPPGNEWEAVGKVVSGYSAVLSRLGAVGSVGTEKQIDTVPGAQNSQAARNGGIFKEIKASYRERRRRRILVSRYSGTDLREIFGGSGGRVVTGVSNPQDNAGDVGVGGDSVEIFSLSKSSKVIKKSGRKDKKSSRKEKKKQLGKDDERNSGKPDPKRVKKSKKRKLGMS